MIQDSSYSEHSSSIYKLRPWLQHYASNVPLALTPQFTNALDLFLATAKNAPEQSALYYFDHIMSYRVTDRKSSALTAAVQSQGISKGDRVALSLQNVPQFLNFIEILDELPKTTTGKFLRRDLRDKV
jgi:long-chain acyl-CoA synthetase